MSDRKAEIERKRKKLEEIRKAKEAKKTTPDVPAASLGGPTSEPTNIDELLQGIDLPSSSTVISGGQTPHPDSHSISSEDSKPTSPTPQKRLVKLSVTQLNATNIPPKEPVLYSKETQTIATKQELSEPEKDNIPEEPVAIPESNQDLEDEKKKKEEKKEEVVKIPEIDEDQKAQILNSQDFAQFFERASRLVERAICENLDICIDYGGTGEEQEGGAEAAAKLTLNRQFFDERWSKHRCITCMDWSTQYPELLVASYNQNETAPQDPDGIALIWNMKFHKASPEYVFHNQSAITSVCFAKFHPNLIVGGTYSGQIVLWDNRSRKRTPVQRTPLSATAHTHPIYCVDVIGTQNAHNLITISTDGRMCSWSLEMLAQPQETMEFQFKQSKNVAVTSMSFLSGDVNNFVVGCEDCSVYSGLRHGNKAGIVEQFDGHSGPVTGIDYHSAPGPIDFSHLFLTCSVDWTIKLWSNKSQKPIYSFEDNGDYVFDVQWSPIHPALFAAVDGTGRLDLWNLNHDTEVPTTSVTVEPLSAINRVRWTASGHEIAVGDDDGHIYIYDVGEQLVSPRQDEWNRFVNTLQELQANSLNVPSSDSSDTKPLLQQSFISPPRI